MCNCFLSICRLVQPSLLLTLEHLHHQKENIPVSPPTPSPSQSLINLPFASWDLHVWPSVTGFFTYMSVFPIYGQIIQLNTHTTFRWFIQELTGIWAVPTFGLFINNDTSNICGQVLYELGSNFNPGAFFLVSGKSNFHFVTAQFWAIKKHK